MSEAKGGVLERAVITLLRPLARLLLSRGVAYGRFAELAKRAFVDAAIDDFAVPGRKLSVSRVAVLTGLTRKEASRLMRDEGEVPTANHRRQINRAARIVSGWVSDPNFRTTEGLPATLPFEAAEGPSFTSLVVAHGGDVGPRAVLDELARVGAVEETGDEVRLVERAYIPARDEGTKLEILGSDVADLIDSIRHNLELERDAPFFQRKVAYDHLPASYLPVLRRLLAERGQALLEELNEDMQRHDGDMAGLPVPAEERHRAMIGVYYYEEPQDDD